MAQLHEHQWKEEEEAEEGVGLQRKKHRHRNNNSTSVNNGSEGDASGGGSSSGIHSEAGKASGTADGGGGEEENEEKGERKSNEEEDDANEGEGSRLHNTIYFDKDQGNESVHDVSEMKCNGVECPIFEANAREELDLKVEKFDFQKSLTTLTTEINYENGKNLDDESFAGLRASLDEDATFEQFDNKIKVDAGDDVIEGIDQEVEELDVERVLQKQDTHDLYCPNCYSCITRRVILRRRKRKIRDLRKKSKRDKLETTFHSELDANASCAAANEDSNRVCIGSNDSPTPEAGDYDHDKEPDIFRCLSCFSFFIPTGNGFKLFQVSRDSNENENMQNPQTISAAKTNWFFSIFAMDKRKIDKGNASLGHSEVDRINQSDSSCCSDNVVSCHGSDRPVVPLADKTQVNVSEPAEDVQIKPQQGGLQSFNTSTVESLLVEKSPIELDHKSNMTIENETFTDQNGLASSVQGSSLPIEFFFSAGQPGLVNSAVVGPQEAGKDVVNSSRQEDKLFENVFLVVGEKSDDAMVKNNTVPPFAERSLVNTGEPAEDAILKLKQRELKFMVSSTCQSLTLEPAQMEIDEKSSMAIVNKLAVQNSHTSSIQGLLIDVTTEPNEAKIDTVRSSTQGPQLLEKLKTDVGEGLADAVKKKNTGDGVIVIVEPGPVEPASSQWAQDAVSVEAGSLSQNETRIHMSEHRGAETGEAHQWDILKSIVYGGLIESITSLSVVSSAVGAGAATLTVLALGLANLFGGLFAIGHNLRELRNDHYGEGSNQMNEPQDQYQKLLGRRENFLLHAIVAVLSFLIFGLLPPVIYGFSFRRSDNRELKFVAVMGASLACIILLATGKGHVRTPPKSYVKSVLYYVSIGLMASGISYVVGDLIKNLLDKLGWFDSSVNFTVPFPETKPTEPAWAFY